MKTFRLTVIYLPFDNENKPIYFLKCVKQLELNTIKMAFKHLCSFSILQYSFFCHVFNHTLPFASSSSFCFFIFPLPILLLLHASFSLLIVTFILTKLNHFTCSLFQNNWHMFKLYGTRIIYHSCTTSILHQKKQTKKTKKCSRPNKNQEPLCCAFRNPGILTAKFCQCSWFWFMFKKIHWLSRKIESSIHCHGNSPGVRVHFW